MVSTPSKNMIVKSEHLPRVRGENKKYLKPPVMSITVLVPWLVGLENVSMVGSKPPVGTRHWTPLSSEGVQISPQDLAHLPTAEIRTRPTSGRASGSLVFVPENSHSWFMWYCKYIYIYTYLLGRSRNLVRWLVNGLSVAYKCFFLEVYYNPLILTFY